MTDIHKEHEKIIQALDNLKIAVEAVNAHAEDLYLTIRIRAADGENASIRNYCIQISPNNEKVRCTRCIEHSGEHIARDKQTKVVRRWSDKGTFREKTA